MDKKTPRPLPLAGIRILDLTSAVVGPYATQTLADYGADVIKLEQQSGDIIRWISGHSPTPGMSGKFMHMNRNKRSICVNLKTERGKSAFMKLAAQSHIVIHNMRTDAMTRLGISFSALSSVNPNLIYCNIVGFGSQGRYANRPAYDSILQGATALASLFAQNGNEPRYVPYVVVDRTAALMVANAIMVALYAQTRDPGPREIEVPMFESYATLVLSEHLYGESFDPPISPSGDKRLLDENARPVKTSDGYICVTTNTDAQVLALFDAMGTPQLKSDPRFNRALNRIDHIAEFFSLRAQEMAKHSTQYWLDRLTQYDIPCMPCHTIASLLADPHIADVGLVQKRQHPTQGTIRHLNVPVSMTGFAPTLRHHAPHIGEHTRQILAEAGFGQDDISNMLQAGEAYQSDPQDSAAGS
ncbi:crotonobetainyl-CoA:carnitine CoA-transferase CaiB-like acyl-CoA transferase [Advenella incenata]|jgi:crotonobetainyl-CoA:carnitine CoA-transferase CaiB-like acyl-CoA transferase|uniref:Crotonobetainyl-CoA:carnitine CoA-transferase CaiB-like acyl-CoA transferase n=1 Tax=Advenella incenata TaxID=267800 RepID=A0A4Q7VRX8_9BURK|nr:CoA transferase [Advenella incenata]RZT99283.1 crotonobetainyl-CoA:carnitine CoA-transferase CaiB-like acyl-CoA transferase [Advenella incenata]